LLYSNRRLAQANLLIFKPVLLGLKHRYSFGVTDQRCCSLSASSQSLANRLLGARIAGEFAADKTYRDQLFGRLSAGQRFIIAVAADVVGFIEERSILLFDEPETHLHPGLLSGI
jgi:hypothetical protein